MPGPNTALTPSRAGEPMLAPGQVHCWCVSLDVPPEDSARLYTTLSVEERDRSARFRFPRDRQRFIVAHGALREILGRYLRTSPDQVRYVHKAFGKPELGSEHGGRLEFNLSHSDGIALIALALDSEVGVDVECVRAKTDHLDVARLFFSADEADALSALPEPLQAEAFTRSWTMKEACLKACGGGLEIPLSSVAVPVMAEPAAGPEDLGVAPNGVVQATRWSVYSLQPVPGYVGALAVGRSGWRLSHWRWMMPQG